MGGIRSSLLTIKSFEREPQLGCYVTPINWYRQRVVTRIGPHISRLPHNILNGKPFEMEILSLVRAPH
jgi:hypothetical protein